ncbi:hypothetical protein DM469_00100 [Lactobacillus helveticus]|uniref:Uncharacterized protein n=1 Tax=Lactobacillus helveticus TaxID=1587 RepID=A0AAU8XSR8_LACHE|nr:hypothetical protein [Lactobacillus helveticus]AUI73862.1 hypothetical protein Lh8105_02870 [Lactobacillus helveticus]MCO0806723.1 hypothetical protein [Lactobacillus helveticus]NRN88404.1 hypothetical protein [Lactobacillus helveticus]NRO03704.1 hypothetical protein [Lactobacillus helveticus]NRO38139.1 hypothetical protein [Lactobacillus helveticus]
MELTGFDELQRKLSTLENNVKELDGEHTLSAKELFPMSFMQENTNVSSLQELFPGYDVSSDATFSKIPSSVVEQSVKEHTKFNSWDELKETAAKAYVERKLFENV